MKLEYCLECRVVRVVGDFGQNNPGLPCPARGAGYWMFVTLPGIL